MKFEQMLYFTNILVKHPENGRKGHRNM